MKALIIIAIVSIILAGCVFGLAWFFDTFWGGEGGKDDNENV